MDLKLEVTKCDLHCKKGVIKTAKSLWSIKVDANF